VIGDYASCRLHMPGEPVDP